MRDNLNIGNRIMILSGEKRGRFMSTTIVMSKDEYIKSLVDKGYILINQNKVKLGTIIFKINEGDIKTAMGKQHTFWLTILEKESDLNLISDPWK